jgi:mannosidase alpha-like ER degradation enhancer 1
MRCVTWLACTTTLACLCRATFTAQRKAAARELVRATWTHGFEAYMNHAFPLDELLPLSCRGQGHDHANPANYGVNDIMPDACLTLVDALDSFVVMGNRTGFETAVRQVIAHVSFDQDVKIQVFEVNIRMLGGLLSAHVFASEPSRGFAIPWYKGELLVLARDLANRLLPAFRTATGMPYARVRRSRDRALVYSNVAGAGQLTIRRP